MKENTMVNFKAEIAKDMNNGLNVHDDLKHLKVSELREICDNDRNPFAICAISVTGDLNIGNIIRTGCLLGAERVIILGRRKFDRRGCVGSTDYIDVEQIGGLNDDLTLDENCFIEAMEKYNYRPILIEQNGLSLSDIVWPYFISGKKTRPCLVVGNENRGIPDNILATEGYFDETYNDRASCRVSIPQKGVLRSFNVSNAASIVGFDMCKSMKWL